MVMELIRSIQKEMVKIMCTRREIGISGREKMFNLSEEFRLCLGGFLLLAGISLVLLIKTIYFRQLKGWCTLVAAVIAAVCSAGFLVIAFQKEPGVRALVVSWGLGFAFISALFVLGYIHWRKHDGPLKKETQDREWGELKEAKIVFLRFTRWIRGKNR